MIVKLIQKQKKLEEDLARHQQNQLNLEERIALVQGDFNEIQA